jgi:hypothetical protein
MKHRGLTDPQKEIVALDRKDRGHGTDADASRLGRRTASDDVPTLLARDRAACNHRRFI